MPLIEAARVLILATDGFEQTELFRPRERLKDLGAEVRIAAPASEPIRGGAEGRAALRITPDLTLDEVECGAFDALIIPGGVECATILRDQPHALEIVRGFAGAGKPVAATSGGAFLLAAADVDVGEIPESGDVRRGAGLVIGGGAAQIPAFTDALIDAIEGREAVATGR